MTTDAIREDWRDEVGALSKRVDWLAQRDSYQEATIKSLRDDIAELKASVDRLVALANMGRGAWLTILRLGVLVAGVLGILEALRVLGKI